MISKGTAIAVLILSRFSRAFKLAIAAWARPGAPPRSIVAVPPVREFVELALLRWWDYLLMAAIAAGWALVLRIVWRTRIFEKLFALDGM